MIRALRLSTGPDGHSHLETGRLAAALKIEAGTLDFEETPAGSSLDWHNAPAAQYVINLCGTLEFETKTGERGTLAPGDVLVALDVDGSGHKWRLVDGEPWKRGYVTIGDGRDRLFVADARP